MQQFIVKDHISSMLVEAETEQAAKAQFEDIVGRIPEAANLAEDVWCLVEYGLGFITDRPKLNQCYFFIGTQQECIEQSCNWSY